MNTTHMRKFGLLMSLALISTTAHAGVVVVMSAKSDVSSLTKAQVSQIYLAKSDALPNGKVARPIDQADGAAARNEFYSKVANKDAAQMKAYWSQLTFTGRAKPPREATGDAGVKAILAESPTSIGYISDGAVDSSVKVVFKP